ncbi:uncharacterized protein [Typha angustifolia]|uniref:uncharacterized protein isoform X2 n=1 Tax=Typha angustifolia TaxID=59011 RepID=UPI003C2FAC9C
MNRTPHPKLKPPPRALFSCGIFRNCTQSALSPTYPSSPDATAVLPPPSPPPSAAPQPVPATPPPPISSDPPPQTDQERPLPSSSSSSSSSSTSQSFTQWRFPLHHPQQQKPPDPSPSPATAAPPSDPGDLSDVFHAAELQFAADERLVALRLLERALAGDPPHPCGGLPRPVMDGIVASLRDPTAARAAAKVLLAVLLQAEGNRRAAVEAGAAVAAVEAVASSGPAGATAERALAALELLCTVPEGAAEVRAHEVTAAALARAAEGMAGRGRECAIGVMAAIYSGGGGEDRTAPPSEVARAVVAAMQGECSARGRRKGAQLLLALQESGQLDLAWDGIGGC